MNMTATLIRETSIGDLYRFTPALDGYKYILITRGGSPRDMFGGCLGSFAYASDQDGHVLPDRDGLPHLLYWNDHGWQDLIIDLGYTRQEGTGT